MTNKHARPGDPGQAGKADPEGPNKFEPEKHEAFPHQENYPIDPRDHGKKDDDDDE